MPKILITGSNSFVGTNFRKFSQFEVIDEISLLENKPENIDFTKFDVVLHLAAIVHQSKKIPERDYFVVNRDLCIRVAEKAKKDGVKQFVFLSTLKVYGEFVPDTKLRNENSKCYPNDAYGKSKYAAEIGLKKLEEVNFTVSIIRTPLVYGAGVKANMLKIVKLIDSYPLLPFGKIYNTRNFTYIENLVGFIDRIIEKRASGIFIAMDEKAISTTELVNILSKYLGKKIILFKLPRIIIKIGTIIAYSVFDRLFGSLEFDNTITKNQLDYLPPFSTEEGLEKMISAYKNRKNKHNNSI